MPDGVDLALDPVKGASFDHAVNSSAAQPRLDQLEPRNYAVLAPGELRYPPTPRRRANPPPRVI